MKPEYEYPEENSSPAMTKRSRCTAIRRCNIKIKCLIVSGLILFLLSCATQQANVLKYQDNIGIYRKVQLLNDKIMNRTGDTFIRGYRMSIIDDNLPNAYVYPPKKLLIVTKGLLDNFTDDELTFILCHEFAHIKFQHWEKNYAAAQGITTGFRVLNILIPGAGLGNLIVNPLITRAYSRSQELEADAEAVQSGNMLGLSPDIYVDALKKLREIAIANGFKDSDRTGILDTHPNLKERISKIKQKQEIK